MEEVQLEDNTYATGFYEERFQCEDFRIWKKNSPFLYDVLVTTALDWPSLCVDWLEYTSVASDKKSMSYRLAFGTHTNDEEDNYLKIADVRVPYDLGDIDIKNYETTTEYKPNRDNNTSSNQFNQIPNIDTKMKIPHPHEINRLLHCPAQPFLMATKTTEGGVLLYNYSRHPSVSKDNISRPLLQLKGHNKEGYALNWSTLDNNYIVSGAEDCKVCIWDVNTNPISVTSAAGTSTSTAGNNTNTAVSTTAATGSNDTSNVVNVSHKAEEEVKCVPTAGYINPLYEKTLNAPIEDVSFCKKNSKCVFAALDDGYVHYLDSRVGTNSSNNEVIKYHAHYNGVSSVSICGFNSNLIATGGGDRTVALWDIRKLGSRLYTLDYHTSPVMRVHFAPFAEPILASASADGKILLWDLSRIGQKGTEREEKSNVDQSPSELLFIHSGHFSRINDFSWNHNAGGEWMIASVSEDNQMMVWRPAEHVFINDL